VCERRINLLVCSLSLHRHSCTGFILAFASSIHNKQKKKKYTLSLNTTQKDPDISGQTKSPVCRWAVSTRNYQFLSINSLKVLMIHFIHRIPRVYHVIHSIILPSSVNRSKCYLHESSFPFFLKPCVKISRIYPPDGYRNHHIRDFGDPRFMFYVVYGFDLSDRIWHVCIVMTLVVSSLFGWVFSTIITDPSYIPFCLYLLPKCHMMCAPS
jgi:hypothetical protein